MREWFKYDVALKRDISNSEANGSYFDHYAAQMGGYQADDSYESRKSFFDRHLEEEGCGRLKIYNSFLRNVLIADMKILSVASGRAANELALMQDGFNITCSDLGLPACLPETKKLFGEFNYKLFDVLSEVGQQKYDAVICLSLIYNFDKYSLNKFFRNIYQLLNDNGVLALDYVAAPDNVWSYLLHDLYLPMEARLYALYRSINERQAYTVVKKFHGYRRTNYEIESSAQAAGLALRTYNEEGERIDFYRGYILPKLINKPGFSQVLSWIGRKMPYVRMGEFYKTG